MYFRVSRDNHQPHLINPAVVITLLDCAEENAATDCFRSDQLLQLIFFVF